MSNWKISYLVHAAVWVLLCLLALFYEAVAFSPIYLVFIISGISYQFLGLITGATDPVAAHGGSQIPEIAWYIYGLFWLFIAIFGVAFGIKNLIRGRPALILLVLHVLLFFVGLILLSITGSINFRFSL